MQIKPIYTYYDLLIAKEYVNKSSKKNLSDDEKNTIEVLKILIEHFERRDKMSLDNVVIEPLIDQIYDSVISASKLQAGNLTEKGLKLGEEFGELSAEILKWDGYKKTNLPKEELKKKYF